MKKSFIIKIVCIVLILIGGITWYLVGHKPNSSQNTVVPQGRLKLADGGTIAIPEYIIQNEASTKLPSDVFRDISGGENSNYRISYLPYNKANSQIEFNITLNTLPLSKARLESESALRRIFTGIDDKDLCKMDISVYVFGWVSQEYAGKNLGLSFCDKPTLLP